MPFNEKGEWVNLNPVEIYKHIVKSSELNPGSGGRVWSEEVRTKYHDEAALYLMALEGIENTPENLHQMREKITREMDEEYDIAERDGLRKFLIPEQRPSSGCYKWIGD